MSDRKQFTNGGPSGQGKNDIIRHYFLADDNLLGLDSETEAVIANYSGPQEFLYVLIVRYPDLMAAATAREQFVQVYLGGDQDEAVAQIEDGYWAAAGGTGTYLLAVLDAPNAHRARQLRKTILSRLTGKLEEAEK